MCVWTSNVILVFAVTTGMDRVKEEGAGCRFLPGLKVQSQEQPRGGARMHRLLLGVRFWAPRAGKWETW